MPLTTLDWLIIGGYFAVSLGIGLQTLFGGWAMAGILGAVALVAAALLARRLENG